MAQFLRNRIAKARSSSADVVQAKFQDDGEVHMTGSLDECFGSFEDSLTTEEDGDVVICSSETEAPAEELQFKPTKDNEGPSSQRESDQKSAALSKMTAVVLSPDTEIYEMQLTQLQEQLVATMIENQNLSDELKSFKETSNVQHIKEELELERARNDILVKKCEDMCSQLRTEFVDTDNRQKSEKSQVGDGRVTGDDVEGVVEGEDALDAEDIRGEVPGQKKPGLKERFSRWFLSIVYELAADFSEEDEVISGEDPEGPQLTVKLLRKSVTRFGNGIKPLYGTVKGVNNVLSWKNPAYSVLWFLLYMYFVWCGWIVPLVLFLMIVRLFANYLRQGGWNINLQYFDVEEDIDTKLEDEDKDKPGTFTIVLQVTRKVQNWLCDVADRLEKVNNLLTWEQPRETRDVFFGLCFAFIITCVFSGKTLMLVGGLYLGVKLFIINNLYNRYPRLRRKYDREYKLWEALKTNEQLEKSKQRRQIERSMLPSSLSVTEESTSLWDTNETVLPKEDRKFCDKFELPHAEAPLKGWSKGKNCLLLNKEKIGPSGARPGLLFLTRSFLCWERTGMASQKQTVTIPLSEIESLEKYKPFSILPGSGMSLLVRVVSNPKPYIFGGLFNRDENFNSIMSVGRRELLPWASPCEPSPSSSGKIRLSELSEDS